MLNYYTIWGFYTSSFTFYGKVTSFLIFLVHFVLCAWCTVFTMNVFFEQQYYSEFLDALNSFLYAAWATILYWLIIYDSYVNQRDQYRFWQMFSDFNKNYQQSDDFEKGNHLFTAIIILIANSLYIILTFVLDNATDNGNYVLHFILLNIIDHRLNFYILHLKVITYHLEKIDLKLKNLKINTNVDDKQMKRVRSNYGLVHEMSGLVNTIFGLSQLTLIVLSFYSLIAFLNVTHRLLRGKFKIWNSSKYYR